MPKDEEIKFRYCDPVIPPEIEAIINSKGEILGYIRNEYLTKKEFKSRYPQEAKNVK